MKKIRNYLLSRSREQKTLFLILSDILIFNFNFILAFFFAFFIHKNNLILFSVNSPILSEYFDIFNIYILVINLFSISIIYFLNGYKTFFRSSPANSAVGIERILGAFVFSFLISLLVYLQKDHSPILSFRFGFYFFITIIFYYVLLRTFAYKFLSRNTDNKQIPILIYGAGQAGRETAASLSQIYKYNILGFIDDNPKLKNYSILGSKVLGNIQKVLKIKESYPNLLVILAIINISKSERKKIISLLGQYEIHVKTIPSKYGALETKLSIENIGLNDLIDREIVEKDNLLIKDNIIDKNILITGAGGSIGSEIAYQIASFDPKKLILLDSSEFNLYKLEKDFKSYVGFENMKFYLRDIQIYDEIEKVIKEEKIDIIYHAAAYKHVPLLQKDDNFKMAIKNNFFATFNLCEISKNNNVESFTLISTDKAVNPTSIMGASKRLAEISLQAFQSDEDNTTCFSMVRFGNVLNSSGSVVPFFWDQISKGGPVTVTDKEINRFFMSIEEASSLVLQANALAKGGEVFLLDMGDPIKIKTLAEKMIRLSGNSVSNELNRNGIEIIYTGLRPGEKLYEELLLSNKPISTDHQKIKKGIEKSYPLKKVIDLKHQIEENLLNSENEKINNLLVNYVEGYLPYEE